jgi:hypothetical protein
MRQPMDGTTYLRNVLYEIAPEEFTFEDRMRVIFAFTGRKLAALHVGSTVAFRFCRSTTGRAASRRDVRSVASPPWQLLRTEAAYER